jgi:CPA2 family monovalent cation:H+ antiporter-2
MIFNGGAVLDHAFYILLIAIALIFFKFLTAGFATALLGLSLRTVLLVGFALSQIGEFSFILAKAGQKFELLDNEAYQVFLGVTVLTLVATPFLMRLGRFADFLAQRLPWPSFLSKQESGIERKEGVALKVNHVIIVGFGIVGRNLAHAAKASDISYTVIELNPDTVRRERKGGESILYGDATYKEVLHSAGLKAARALVVTCHDPGASHRVIRVAREINPEVHIVLRARYFSEMKPLLQQGADVVIPDEFETSMEIFKRVLEEYEVAPANIQELCEELRAGGYELLKQGREEKASTKGPDPKG